MAKKLKIVSVCGFGIGSSLILKMAMDNVAGKHNIAADVEPMDITSVTEGVADLVLTSREIGKQIDDKISCPVVAINNFMDEQEIESATVPVLQTLIETS